MFFYHVTTAGPFTGKRADMLFELQIVPHSSKSDHYCGRTATIFDFSFRRESAIPVKDPRIKFSVGKPAIEPHYRTLNVI